METFPDHHPTLTALLPTRHYWKYLLDQVVNFKYAYFLFANYTPIKLVGIKL
jgi:hypothetical protein